MGRSFDRQQLCQEDLLPGIADVVIVARRLQVLTDSSSSPRMEGRGMQGMVEMSVGEFARDIVVRDSELASIADSCIS